MATYRELHGKAVKTVTTNPTDDAAQGQIWFNSTDNTFKSVVALEAWSSTSSLSQKRVDASGFGTQTANVCATGNIPPRTGVTEEYNGSGWTAGGTASQAGQYRSGFGTLTAGAVAGARTPAPASSNATEHYNGTSWTSGGNLPASIYLPGNQAAGTQTAGLVFGGDTGPGSSFPTASYEYDGSSWGSGGSTNTARSYGAGSGTQTAAFFACGTTPPFSVDNASVAFEQYNGSSWTSGPNLNTARISTAAGGDTTAGLVFGGEIAGPAKTNKLETWDGTSWTLSPATLGTARLGTGRALGTGSSTANIASGGYTTTPVATTEEYNKTQNVITAAAWASSGNLNLAREGHGTTTNAAADTGLVFGGNYPSGTDNSESYDGTSWTEGPNLPQALSFLGGAGTATAGLSFTGRLNPGPRVASTYEWDGSSWTAGGDYGAAQAYSGGAGTQTAAIGVAGETPPGTDLTTSYEYNGSAWTAGNACNVPGYDALVFGTSAGAHMSCLTGPPTNLETEEYDGNNWTASATAIVSQNQGGASGTYPIGLIFGGASTVPSTSTQGWDGTAWSTRPSMGTGRRADGSGTTAQGLATGGETPSSPTSNATEEFTPESTSLNVKTLTQS
tara:strand:- start:55 stop:1905 length:1851 start_codon:yes stop_codon:yes gene_type:complete